VILLDLRMHWTGVDCLICWRIARGSTSVRVITMILAITVLTAMRMLMSCELDILSYFHIA
jgi:hypothetical protein